MMSRGPYPVLLILAMSLPGAVRALGLGELRVDSALNEPLRAQIDIVGATRDELAALTATVANRDIFQRYGADRPSFLSTATFKVGMDAQGRAVLNVRSADAFTDPLVSFLVDIRWGKNEMVREYSLLLDPPDYRSTPPASELARASAPATPVSPATLLSPATLSTATSIASAPPVVVTSPSPSPVAAARVTVAAGATLRGITRRAGARTEAQTQTLMIAIFRANPNAFDGNINRLHRGAVLTIPAAADVAAISGATAQREVRVQMTAWRMDSRPGGTPRFVASHAPLNAAAPPMVKNEVAPDASLKNRVQSLEAQLDDLHNQLASENTRIQALQRITPPEPAAPQAAPQVAPLIAAIPVPVSASAAAPPATVVHPASANAAELDSAPRLTPTQPITTMPAVVSASRTSTSNAEIFGPAALTLALLVAGFAFIRRRLQRTPLLVEAAILPPIPVSASAAALPVQLPIAMPAAAAQTANIEVVAPLGEPMSPLEAFKPTVRPPAEAPRRPALVIADTVEQTMPMTSLESTSALEIDIEALELSYLESLPIPSASADAFNDDPALAETTTVETVSIEPQDLDLSLAGASLNTVLIASPPMHGPTLDFNLMDLDATVHHVHMPSGLNDQPVTKERRTNIVDVLKVAIERDPKRRDLRMKLLETYYSIASTNQRAFMEVVRKLSREKDLLTPDDWRKVTVMGREIAADDILFADLDPPKDGEDLAHCA